MIQLSTKHADFSESPAIPRETRDFNVGYGEGVLSDPSDDGTFKQEMVKKMLNWIELLNKKNEMVDALSVYSPADRMSDWSGDAQSPPLRTRRQKRIR